VFTAARIVATPQLSQEWYGALPHIGRSAHGLPQAMVVWSLLRRHRIHPVIFLASSLNSMAR
jgi:hypothetical protein